MSHQDKLAWFRETYDPPKQPRVIPSKVESLLLDATDELRQLEPAPVYGIVYGMPPQAETGGTARYLWVISEEGIPYLQERPMERLGGALPKHTNLTGGRPAYIGGEVWFSDSESMYVSGGSGRYPPRDETQLMDAVTVFESYGYRVRSLGWDSESQRALRVLEP